MNRIIFACIAVCFLVAPAFALPTNDKLIEGAEELPPKRTEENEVNGVVNRDVNRDVETIDSHETKSDEIPDTDTTSSVIGQSTGIITRIGIDGTCK